MGSFHDAVLYLTNTVLSDDDAKKATSKLLTKWRPHVLLVAAEPIKADSPIPSRPVSAV